MISAETEARIDKFLDDDLDMDAVSLNGQWPEVICLLECAMQEVRTLRTLLAQVSQELVTAENDILEAVKLNIRIGSIDKIKEAGV